jgi:GntR family transcriptional repressor for pyruvate dehydrogenase complex
MKVDEFRRLDRVFHTTIANACGNPLLTELYNKVLDRLFHSEGFASLLSDELNRSEVRAIVTTSVEAHHELAKAFAQADPVAMAKAAKDHVTSVEQRMLADLI